MDERNLVRQAIIAREKSYSPYSNFMVGAALLAESGKIYLGCNIENAAYSPTICAERTAFSKAVSEGERSFVAIAIAGWPKDGEIYVSEDELEVEVEVEPKPELISGTGNASSTKQGADRARLQAGQAGQAGAYPCGVCRQVMMEFCEPDRFRIIVAASEDSYRVHTLNELLPYGFGAKNLKIVAEDI